MKLHAGILCNNNLFASVCASSWRPDRIWLGPILTPCNHPNSYICDKEWRPRILCSILQSHCFLPAFGGQISFYRGRFSIEWASYCRIFQPSEDVTENMIFAVYILHQYQFLVVFSGQISFDGGDCPGNWFHGRYYEFVNMSREHVSTMYLLVFASRISSDGNCFLSSWVIQANGPGVGNAYICKRFQIVPSMTM